ncbi:MAG: metallophosphoesterase family protein [bacterium]|nr:metallophosphoesterase family protein [bacterium]
MLCFHKMTPRLTLILALALMAPAVPPPGDTPLRKGPYLIFPGDNTQMTILWQTWDTVPGTVAWGEDSHCSLGQLESVERDDHQHRVTLDGLTPDTLYHCRVTVEAEDWTGTFRTAPTSDATALSFFVYGDSRSNPAQFDAVNAAIVHLFQGDPALQTFIAHAGDYVGEGRREEDWDNDLFNRQWPNTLALLGNLPLQGCWGNHEGEGDLFRRHFPYPFVEAAYWSFDWGPVHVAVLDQSRYHYGSPADWDAQMLWLESDLATTSRPWKIVLLHEPGYSAGNLVIPTDPRFQQVIHPNQEYVQTDIQPLCERFGVALVFGGDNHCYARCEVNGVTHITTAGAGAPLYPPDPDYDPTVVATAQAHHFCLVNIEGDALTLTALTPAGDVLDEFTITPPPARVGETDLRRVAALLDAHRLVALHDPPTITGHLLCLDETLIDHEVALAVEFQGETHHMTHTLAATRAENHFAIPLPTPTEEVQTATLVATLGGEEIDRAAIEIIAPQREHNVVPFVVASVETDSIYAGYRTEPLCDGVTATEEINWRDAAWASEDADGPHHVTLAFTEPTTLERVTIHWAVDGDSIWTSQQVNVIGLTPNGVSLDLGTVTNAEPIAASALTFGPQSFAGLRFEQPPLQGPTARPTIMWIREIEAR